MLLVDKPSGPTSHDVVGFARRVLGTSRIGHTGTLDPLATGLLVLLVGPATRLARFAAADEKEYLADVRLGLATATYDAEGLTAEMRADCRAAVLPDADAIDKVLSRFRGTFVQTPPPYSAKKVAGVRAYDSARDGKAVALAGVEVTVRALERLVDASAADPGLLRLRVAASAGFYVRSLAHEIGAALGCGAHLEALRRTRVGSIPVEQAATLDAIDCEGPRLLPPQYLLSHLPAATLNGEGLRRARHGSGLGPGHSVHWPDGVAPDGLVSALDGSGRLVCVARQGPDGLLHPLVVLG